jgi:hypothetical protein
MCWVSTHVLQLFMAAYASVLWLSLVASAMCACVVVVSCSSCARCGCLVAHVHVLWLSMVAHVYVFWLSGSSCECVMVVHGNSCIYIVVVYGSSCARVPVVNGAVHMCSSGTYTVVLYDNLYSRAVFVNVNNVHVALNIPRCGYLAEFHQSPPATVTL